ncbi:two-component system response regulator YesN [Paenibacillus endophyticus]|uniref:Two-component system response regulator YesN n=1 Tax=Paenibacillus endophyticus TaxID=1294268 RepID=A0A7W5CCE1_9BACL|nr:response regulator [Paenibacillus endophyticus]MBB3155132.1 two-component system response regulator YesN [Paenibacillus endophyticus]
MIKVLIVDDEKIVRKGLVSFMPWQDFGMVVVGEANNGENALQFLETNKVDLLLTDLSMPVMSGIELMKEVRRIHPNIQIVVLTLHQDFEYVQEALRLGAIDYIAKTQLEKEQFKDVLSRISSLFDTKKPTGYDSYRDELDQVDELYVIYLLNGQSDDSSMGIVLPKGAIELDAGVWGMTYLPPESLTSCPDYAMIFFRDLKELDRKSIVQLTRVYRRNEFFYEYHPMKSIPIVHNGTISTLGENADYDLIKLKRKWLSPDWIYEDQAFETMLQELIAIKLPPIRLTRLFFSLSDEWNRLYEQILIDPIVMDDSFAYFAQFESWLRNVRNAIHQANSKPQYSKEIQNSIAKAANMAQLMMNQSLSAGEMAQIVNMSSSYFSQCFKQIVGKTYTDYLRDIRLERAKHYLINTTKTIQWIAEQVGYNDEKYFSRLFREHVGILPSDYRQTNKQV